MTGERSDVTLNEAQSFGWLVEYHATENLREMLDPRYFWDGQIHDAKGKVLKEGSDKGNPQDGIMFFMNGNTLLEELVQDGRVNRKDIDHPEKIETKEQFFSYIKNRNEEDGVHVFETALGEMYRVAYITPRESVTVGNKLPKNFLSEDSNGEDLELKVGTKTRLALDITSHYTTDDLDVSAFQIKRTASGHLRMGKVTYTKSNGLYQEFMMDDEPSHQGPFIDAKHGIYGICREYIAGEDGLELVSESYVDFDENGKIRYTPIPKPLAAPQQPKAAEPAYALAS